MNEERRTATVEYDKFECSLFEMPGFRFWDRKELGPFHIGHELNSRSEVEEKFALVSNFGAEVMNEPFEREDGDFAFFFKDPQGIVFEFFSGGHHAVRIDDSS